MNNSTDYIHSCVMLLKILSKIITIQLVLHCRMVRPLPTTSLKLKYQLTKNFILHSKMFQIHASKKFNRKFIFFIIFLQKNLFIKRLRDLSSAKIGSLMSITAQVTRTHPVHPELVSGTFTCLDCQTVIKNVQQQFKYTQVNKIFFFKLVIL